MYISEPFQIKQTQHMYKVIKDNSFATIFSLHNGKPYATHIPLWLTPDETCLIGHISRLNEQWIDISHQEVLVVFQGPHCYISPNYYENQLAVPTWNYVVVHVYGKVELLDSSDPLLISSMIEMAQKYEKTSNHYSINNLNTVLLKKLMTEIVGLKININKMEGKAKLSQNHSVQRRKHIIEHLRKSESENERKIADLLEETIDNLN